MKLVVGLLAWLALHGPAVAAEVPTPGDAAAPPSPDAGAPDAKPTDASGPPVAAPVAAPLAVPPPPLPPPPPARPVAAYGLTEIKDGPPGPDEWPIEYVLRPQTIPAGRLLASLGSSAYLIDGDFRDPHGVKYWSWYQGGGSVTFGVTDRIEFSTYVPRLICEDAGAPSGCSDYARVSGSGLAFGFGVLRTRTLQLELMTSADIVVTNPLTFAVAVGARTKLLIAGRVALELALAANKWIDAPPGYQETAFGSATLDLNLQLTHNLLAWVDLEPNAALDHLDEPRLAPFGGLSWTFENAVQLRASGGVFNVLARRAWDTSLPGKYVTLALAFWI